MEQGIFLQPPDGVRYEFTPTVLCRPIDVYVNTVLRSATRILVTPELSVIFHQGATNWTTSGTAGRIMAMGHGIVTPTTVIFWATNGTLPTGLLASHLYLLTPVDVNVLQVTETSGASVVWVCDTQDSCWFARPDPPLITDSLSFAGVASQPIIHDNTLVGDWMVGVYRARYAPNKNNEQCAEALTLAVNDVYGYVTESAWANFLQRLAPHTLIKRVIAQIATWYLAQEDRSGSVIEREQTFADSVMTLRERYQANDRFEAATLDDLLRQLAAYRRTTEPVEDDLGYLQEGLQFVWHGTGRFIS